MGGEGFVQATRSGNLVEPPATWPPAKFFAIKIKFLRYHTKLDHPPIIKRVLCYKK